MGLSRAFGCPKLEVPRSESAQCYVILSFADVGAFELFHHHMRHTNEHTQDKIASCRSFRRNDVELSALPGCPEETTPADTKTSDTFIKKNDGKPSTTTPKISLHHHHDDDNDPDSLDHGRTLLVGRFVDDDDENQCVLIPRHAKNDDKNNQPIHWFFVEQYGGGCHLGR